MYQEPQEQNDLFFTCSLIEYISRKTKNEKKYIVEKLGVKYINRILKNASVYHSENIDKVADEFIECCSIDNGVYDNISDCKYRIPSYFEIGRVYQRLIFMIDDNSENYVDNIIKVLSSDIIKTIDNYNCSMFYENPDYIYQCYVEGKIL